MLSTDAERRWKVAGCCVAVVLLLSAGAAAQQQISRRSDAVSLPLGDVADSTEPPEFIILPESLETADDDAAVLLVDVDDEAADGDANEISDDPVFIPLGPTSSRVVFDPITLGESDETNGVEVVPDSLDGATVLEGPDQPILVVVDGFSVTGEGSASPDGVVEGFPEPIGADGEVLGGSADSGVPLDAAGQLDTNEIPLGPGIPLESLAPTGYQSPGEVVVPVEAAGPQEDTALVEEVGVPLADVQPAVLPEDTMVMGDTEVPLAAVVPEEDTMPMGEPEVPLEAVVPEEDTMPMGEPGVPLEAAVPEEATMPMGEPGVPLEAVVPQEDVMPQDVMPMGDSGVPLAAAMPVEDVPPADVEPLDTMMFMEDPGVPLVDAGPENEAMVSFEPTGPGDLPASVDENAIPESPPAASDPAIPSEQSSAPFEVVPEEPVFPDPPPFPVDEEPVVEDMADFMPFEPVRDEVPLMPTGDSMPGLMSDGMGMETLEPTETPVVEADDPAIILDSSGFGDVLPPSGGPVDAPQEEVFEDTFIPFMPEEMFSKLPQMDGMMPDVEPMSDAEVFVPEPPVEELEAMLPVGPALIEVQEDASLPPIAVQDMSQLPEIIADDVQEGQVFQETPPTVEPAIPVGDLEMFFVAEDPEVGGWGHVGAGDTPTAVQGQEVVLEVAQQLPEDQFDIAPLDGIAPFMADGVDVGTLQEEFESAVLLFPDEGEEEEEEGGEEGGEEGEGVVIDTFMNGDFG
ncbi:hypothetical protein C7M84_008147 [Penaeus vannamei]|uniref:Uncharacterized protein n=1 Tax=Penaeus vannamei TaxID=6689 RepID=A0A3R7QBA8_PENVA|nr:hypothetical protein C7M84_008147 [Penaeus vannamei]